jgi:hypothetical protein
MSHTQQKKLAPFISIFILVVIGLVYVFVKMECVRTGYDVVRLGHLQKVAANEKATSELLYAKLTRPERLDLIGTRRLALVRAQKNQVVVMASTESFTAAQ